MGTYTDDMASVLRTDEPHEGEVVIRYPLPSCRDAALDAISVGKFIHALHELEHQLRSWYKYGHDFKSADEAVEKIRERFYEILDECDAHSNEG